LKNYFIQLLDFITQLHVYLITINRNSKVLNEIFKSIERQKYPGFNASGLPANIGGKNQGKQEHYLPGSAK